MSPDFETILIAVVFASQIGVLSFFTPYQRRKNHAFLVTSFPPAEYPRLYPVPKEEMDRRLALFRPVHFAIGIASMVTAIAGLLYAEGPFQYARWMFCCLVAQIVPMYVMMPWAFKMQRAFRAMPPPTVRSAALRPWGIADFVTPTWIVLGLVLQAFALTGSVLLYSYRARATFVALYVGAVSILILVRMAYVLLTPLKLVRADPYMSPEDTFRVRRRRFNLLFRAGAALGAFFVFMILYDAQLVRFDFGYLLVGMSVTFQLLGLMLVSTQKRDLQRRDFSVYRAEAQNS